MQRDYDNNCVTATATATAECSGRCRAKQPCKLGTGTGTGTLVDSQTPDFLTSFKCLQSTQCKALCKFLKPGFRLGGCSLGVFIINTACMFAFRQLVTATATPSRFHLLFFFVCLPANIPTGHSSLDGESPGRDKSPQNVVNYGEI